VVVAVVVGGVKVMVTEAVAVIVAVAAVPIVVVTVVVTNGTADVVTVVLAEVTSRLKTPRLPVLFWSPRYVAVILAGEIDDGVYVTAQLPPESVHSEEGEKFATPLLAHDTVPVGR
jgi:hypothetical protein